MKTNRRDRCDKRQSQKDIKTKNLVNRLKPGDIAVIKHEDIDEVAAVNLAEKRVESNSKRLPFHKWEIS